MSKVPKYIKEKAKRAERLALDAHLLVAEVEEWIEKQGIDFRTLKEEYIIDEISGCDYVIDVAALEKYLSEEV